MTTAYMSTAHTYNVQGTGAHVIIYTLLASLFSCTEIFSYVENLSHFDTSKGSVSYLLL